MTEGSTFRLLSFVIRLRLPPLLSSVSSVSEAWLSPDAGAGSGAGLLIGGPAKSRRGNQAWQVSNAKTGGR
jgi:hypothetical protein